jgi:hypothetical protein
METYVCGDCIDDYAVKQFIKQQAEELSCDYCQQRAEDIPIAAAIAEVGGFMREGIEKEWSLHFLAALAVTLGRHGGDYLSLLHRQPHLLPPAPCGPAAVSTFSSRFLYEATNTFWSRFSVESIRNRVNSKH